MTDFQKLVVVVFLLCGALNVYALDPIYTGIFSDKAIKGYDTVAYFTEGKPIKGKEQFSIEYMKATWLFSSQQNLDLFTGNPQKYAPQYGGYCAYACLLYTSPSPRD